MEEKEVYMRIGEFAEFFEVSQKALRIYEKMELLRPAYIDEETGYRYYVAEQIQQLNTIVELKALGFTLKEIKHILRDGIGAEQFLSMLKKKQTEWEEQKQMAEHKMEMLDTIMERVRGTNGANVMEQMSEEERAWLLARMVCVEDMKVQHTVSEAIWL